jgi:hypothetical protein
VHGARPLVSRVRAEAARGGAAALVLVLTAGGCASGTGQSARLPGPEPTSRPGPDFSDADLWLSFEGTTLDYDGASAYPDALGGPSAGRVVTANGGRVERVPGPRGRGAAVGFPRRCTAPRGCPRAMLEILSGPGLNPGERDFEYGASVWLSPDQTTTASNILQKGRFGTDGGQWKLQVDDDAGAPSCVVRSGAESLIVRSTVSIADSEWHPVVCRRDSEGLSIRVDESVDRVRGRTSSVSNQWPVTVGSPGVGDHDDQFHGRVDDVFLRIGPEA